MVSHNHFGKPHKLGIQLKHRTTPGDMSQEKSATSGFEEGMKPSPEVFQTGDLDTNSSLCQKPEL